MGPNAKSTGLFTFSFRTEYRADSDWYAAYVEYYDIDLQAISGYQKRQEESLNGTLYTQIIKGSTQSGLAKSWADDAQQRQE